MLPIIAHRTRTCPEAIVLTVALLVASCSGSDPQRPSILTNAADITVCCQPTQTPPLKVGEFQIQFLEGQFDALDPATVSRTFTSELVSDRVQRPGQHAQGEPVRLSLSSGDPLDEGSTTIEVYVDDCDFDLVRIHFVGEISGRRISDQRLEVYGIDAEFDVVNTCRSLRPLPTQPQVIAELIVGSPIDDFEQFGIDAPIGVPTCNPYPVIAPQVPVDPFTETFQVGVMVVELDQAQLDAAFLGFAPAFPEGLGEHGYTLIAGFRGPMPPGRYLLAWQCVQEPVPLASADQLIELAFVADRDGDSMNNFQAGPPRDKDPFDDTDLWYLASYDRFGMFWSLLAYDARMSPPAPVRSGVRMILHEQVVFFVIPVGEFGGSTEILSRFTTFAHEGDFGAGSPWSADATPTIDEPRLPILLPPNP